ncbi:MAG: hypothetical protein ACREJN_04650 [Nitrospiraceae bacterium]
MTPTSERDMKADGGSAGRGGAGIAERVEESVGSVDQTIESAAQTIQQTLRRTKSNAIAGMGTVVDGIETSAEYLTDRGMEGVVADVETLIRRYPFQALLIGSSVGFLLSRSWRR